MGNRHQEAMRTLVMPQVPKAVLSWFCYHACNACGVTFSGALTLSEDTCADERTVRRAIDYLRAHQHLVVTHPGGGRGRTTEYLVLPLLSKFTIGRCERCRKIIHANPETVAYSQGFKDRETVAVDHGKEKTMAHGQGNQAGGTETLAQMSETMALRPINHGTPPPQPDLTMNQTSRIRAREVPAAEISDPPTPNPRLERARATIASDIATAQAKNPTRSQKDPQTHGQ